MHSAIQYDRTQLSNGEYWRYLSANFIHIGWAHLGMNIGAVLLVVMLFPNSLTTFEWWLVSLFSGLCVGFFLYFLNPELEYYVGFSGCVHGLVVAASWRARKETMLLSLSVFVLVVAKLSYEQIFGAVPGSAELSSGFVIVNSHLIGTISGLLVIFIIDFLVSKKDSKVIKI